jgi:glycosyltransferase involved in cell wall biosynthesis
MFKNNLSLLMKKKLVVFNTLFYPYKIGGAEKSVEILIGDLEKKGYRVYIITLCSENDKLKNVERFSNCIIIRVKVKENLWPFSNVQRNILNKLRFRLADLILLGRLYKYNKILKRIDSGIVITNNLLGFGPWVWLSSKMSKAKVIHITRDYANFCSNQTMFKKGHLCENQCIGCKCYSLPYKLFGSVVDFHVGISQFVTDLAVKLGYYKNAKHVTIYNKIISDKKLVDLIPVNKKIKRIGYIGRIESQKGIDTIYKLASKFNEYDFYIAGNGNDKSIDMVSYENMSYLGYVESSEFFSNIDLLIVPSKWNEPFGRVVIEAISSNIPVLTSKNGGLKELVHEKYSFQEQDILLNFVDILNDIEVNGYDVKILDFTSDYCSILNFIDK